jgi:hypothetical protein
MRSSQGTCQSVRSAKSVCDAQVDGLGADWSEPEAGSHRHLLLEESIVARRNPPEREGKIGRLNSSSRALHASVTKGG